MPQQTVNGPTGNTLKSKLAINNLPPSLANFSAASSYLTPLAPLAYRGTHGLSWDSGFIERRSEHLCERVFDMLDGWLQ